MKTPQLMILLAGVACSAGLPAMGGTTTIRSDLAPRFVRQSTLDTAARIAQRPAAATMPATVSNPFNPSGFDATVPPPEIPEIVPPKSDREMLKSLSMTLRPSGTLGFQGALHLILGGRRHPVGSKLTVEFEGAEHELQLTALDHATFTVRYRDVELTRPINVAK